MSETPATEITGEGQDGVDEMEQETAAAVLLQSLATHGVEYMFSNFGTDHTPIIEARARLEAKGLGDTLPEVVLCQHEFVAISAAHGYASVTGRPQAVLVHVDVGTQNLGAAMHNAHRATVPIFIISGLAPVTDSGFPGSRDHVVHYSQDVFDQPGILREYLRWESEFRPPADPDALVARGLQRSRAEPPGPTFLTATREALETPANTTTADRSIRTPRLTTPTEDGIRRIVDLLEAAEHPLLITGNYRGEQSAIVEFAESAGVGVVEHSPVRLSFPRDHAQHVGFDPSERFDQADLVLVAATDVPWVPANGSPSEETTVVQIDPTPTKPTYPHWDFQIDETIPASPDATFRAVTSRLAEGIGDTGRAAWTTVAEGRRASLASDLESDYDAGKLTPAVLTDLLNDIVDESTIVVEDAVTSNGPIMNYLELTEPGSFHRKGGAGLGFGGGAGIGAKLANPDGLVMSLTGDGSYIFAHPSATAWLSKNADAPTLTVVYNNAGWNAVRAATAAEHPDGHAVDAGVPESQFDTIPDLSAPAQVVDAYSQTVETVEEVSVALDEALEAIENGKPAVLDVRLDKP